MLLTSSQPKKSAIWPRKVTFGRVSVKVYKRLTPAGKVGFRVENYATGKRQLISCKSEADALETASRLAKQLSQRDVISASLTREQSIEYANAIQSLEPLGLSLTAAVAAIAQAIEQVGDLASVAAAIRFYKAKHKTLTQKTVTDVVSELIDLKKSRGASERYLEDLQFRLDKFAEAFQCNISNVTTADVQTWLDKQKKTNGDSLSSQSYNNNRRVIHLLCEFAVSRNYVHDNAIAAVDKVKIKNGECEVFTPSEAAKLLANVSEDFLPCLALGLFAGIRSAELERLKWEDVKLNEKHIVVRQGAAKTASRRIMPISENLALWLAPYVEKKGNVWPHGRVAFHKREHSTAKLAGIVWKRNAMRHSFASYSLAILNDAGRVASFCGNSPKVIHRHYKQLVTKTDAEKFFEIVPPKVISGATTSLLENINSTPDVLFPTPTDDFASVVDRISV